MRNFRIRKGVIADLITPLDCRGELCLQSARNLADHVRYGGCTGAFVGGAMGGFPHIDVRKRVKMAEEIALFGVDTIFHVSHQNKDIEASLVLQARANHASAVALLIDGVTWDDGIEAVIARIERVVDAASHLPTLLVIDDARWISASHFAQICTTSLISGVIADTSSKTRYADMKRWTQMFGLDSTLLCASDELFSVSNERGIRRLISATATVHPKAMCRAPKCFCGDNRALATDYDELLRCAREVIARTRSWSLPLYHATLYAMNLISSPVPPPPYERLDDASIEALSQPKLIAL